MTNEEFQQRRYPVGEYEAPSNWTQTEIDSWIEDIRSLPSKLREAVKGLTDEQLEWTYRPDGWTIRQVVHHCADSHINSIMRFKLALSEDHPTIRPYNEVEWAKLVDSEGPIEMSLALVDSLHARWVYLLERLTPEQLHRTYYHPDDDATRTVGETIALYAWHCRHHLAHVVGAVERQGK